MKTILNSKKKGKRITNMKDMKKRRRKKTTMKMNKEVVKYVKQTKKRKFNPKLVLAK